jgi:hypothetical protein
VLLFCDGQLNSKGFPKDFVTLGDDFIWSAHLSFSGNLKPLHMEITFSYKTNHVT